MTNNLDFNSFKKADEKDKEKSASSNVDASSKVDDKKLAEKILQNKAKIDDEKTAILIKLSRLIQRFIDDKTIRNMLLIILVIFGILLIWSSIVLAFGTVEGASEGTTFIIIHLNELSEYDKLKIPTIMHLNSASAIVTATLSIVAGFLSGVGAIAKK